MNPLDIGIIIISGFCIVRGLLRGFIKEFTSIVGLFIACLTAFAYYQLLSNHLGVWIPNFNYLNIVSLLLIFCVVFLVINLLGTVISYVINFAFMRWLDKLLGLALGTVKGCLIIFILTFLLTLFLPKNSIFISESLLMPYISKSSKLVVKLIPSKMKNNFEIKTRELNKEWEKL